MDHLLNIFFKHIKEKKVFFTSNSKLLLHFILEKNINQNGQTINIGPIIQWLRYFPCTEEIRVRFAVGPCFESKVRFATQDLAQIKGDAEVREIFRGPKF